jgi:NAD(P)-dependent dehydrogenase (short-subunit alcohol dehydrogenase family)
MRILIIGGNGIIGKHLTNHLKKDHKVIVGGRHSGDVRVDISDSASILAMYKSLGKLEAVVCAAGEAKWDYFEKLSEEDYYIGLRSKLMGQVNLVRLGVEYVDKKGSFTLTTGILADDPVLMTTSAAMVNGGIHSFVKAAALEMPKQQRINVVSSGLVEDAVDKYESYFPGHNPVPMTKVVNAYLRSILGKTNGTIIRVYE